MPKPKQDVRVQRISPSDQRFRIKFSDYEGWFFSPYTDRARALAWATRNKADLIAQKEQTCNFGILSAGFFDRGGTWDRDQVEHGWTRTDATLNIYQGFLENHFLGAFGSRDIRSIEAFEIKNAVQGFVRLNGQPYARATRNKMLYALSLMWTYWQSIGKARENPLSLIVKYNKAPERPRSALPRDALEKLFPKTHGEAVKLYGSSMYASLFFCMNDTGARPGELRALRWGQIDFEKRFIPFRTAIEASTRDKVKTTKTGIVRPGYPSDDE